MSFSDYLSTRVYDGIRILSKEESDRLKRRLKIETTYHIITAETDECVEVWYSAWTNGWAHPSPNGSTLIIWKI
jgi:hypothetical protein